MTTKEYQQITWDEDVEDDCRQLVRLAVREDLGRLYDWTTVSLVPENALGRARVAARKSGVIARIHAARVVLEEYDPQIKFNPCLEDGASVQPGQLVAELSGAARSLLTAERPLLNLLGHLSGIASMTRSYVEAVAGTSARIYDTRKTMPGWRRLEKLAVRAGGGWNHRLGLFDAVLIKDNHLALGASTQRGRYSPAEAITKVRDFLRTLEAEDRIGGKIVEVEVDTLEQFAEVLPAAPDVVLLDNFSLAQLGQAVALRNADCPQIVLEASGGIDLTTVAQVAATGVDRISVGALTHSAHWFDVGLDWI